MSEQVFKSVWSNIPLFRHYILPFISAYFTHWWLHFVTMYRIQFNLQISYLVTCASLFSGVKNILHIQSLSQCIIMPYWRHSSEVKIQTWKTGICHQVILCNKSDHHMHLTWLSKLVTEKLVWTWITIYCHQKFLQINEYYDWGIWWKAEPVYQ